MRKRQLGEGEQRGVATAALVDQPIQPVEGRLGIPAERLVELPALQDVLPELARHARTEPAARQSPRDLARRHAAEADRRPTGSQEKCSARGHAAAQRATGGASHRRSLYWLLCSRASRGGALHSGKKWDLRPVRRSSSASTKRREVCDGGLW